MTSLSITTSKRPSVGGIGGAIFDESSSSPSRERSKLPEGLKATEAETSARRSLKREVGKRVGEVEVGLEGIHGGEEGRSRTVEGDSGSRGFTAAAMISMSESGHVWWWTWTTQG